MSPPIVKGTRQLPVTMNGAAKLAPKPLGISTQACMIPLVVPRSRSLTTSMAIRLKMGSAIPRLGNGPPIIRIVRA